MVPVALRAGGDRGHVASRVGLREAVGALPVAGDDLRDDVVLQVRGSVVEDRGAGQAGDDHEQRRGGVDPGHLFDEDGVGDPVGPVAAVLLGVGQPDEAGVAVRLEGLPGELGPLVGLGGVGRDLLLGEAPDRGPERFVLIGEDEPAHPRAGYPAT